MNSNVDIEELKKNYADILHDYGIEKNKVEVKKINDEKKTELGRQLMELLMTKNLSVFTEAEKLIKKGADVNYKESTKGYFPLLICARKGYDSLAALLINYGADVNLADYYGTTTLMSAARHNNSKLCTVLLHLGADVNAMCSDGDTALFSAKMHGNDNVVKILLEHNAYLYHKNNKGETILDIQGDNTVINSYIDKEVKTISPASHEAAMKLVEEASKEILGMESQTQSSDTNPHGKEETKEQTEEKIFGVTKEEFDELYDENNGFNEIYPEVPFPDVVDKQTGGRQRTRKKPIEVLRKEIRRRKLGIPDISEESRKIIANDLTKLD